MSLEKTLIDAIRKVAKDSGELNDQELEQIKGLVSAEVQKTNEVLVQKLAEQDRKINDIITALTNPEIGPEDTAAHVGVLVGAIPAYPTDIPAGVVEGGLASPGETVYGGVEGEGTVAGGDTVAIDTGTGGEAA